jgi:hypothetical protein
MTLKELARLQAESKGANLNAFAVTCYRTDFTALAAQWDEMVEAFDILAQWNDGPVGPHMDEPRSAEIARHILAKVKA